MDDRRQFLIRVLKGAAYSAPLISTVAAPSPLLAQGMGNSQKGMMMGMMGMGGMGMGGMGGMGMGGMMMATPFVSPQDIGGAFKPPPWSGRPPGGE